ncbi:MAG: putative DNA-binding domain-containing protein, partial [Burkholderiales bacterium]|nr:putative DNA-binding domain-containing protein [Burkholderiales bacterium]
MHASLPELQRRFAAWLAGAEGAPERIAVYRNTVTANYRNALGATYRVVRELVGAPFFNTAVDAFVRAHPSAGGDLNVYGGEFAAFLAAYPHARGLPYLPDVARLEWALDEALRAADPQGSPAGVVAALGALGTDEVARQRFTLDPSCRLLRSDYPVMRIWQAHQAGQEDLTVAFDAGGDHLLVRREGDAPVIVRLPVGEFAWL